MPEHETDTLEHECRKGRRCATRTRTPDGEYRGGGIETPGLCTPCEEHAFDAMNELHTDWARLDGALTATRKSNTPQIGGTNAHPIPLRLDVAAISAEIETEVIRWARVVTRGNVDLPAVTGTCVSHCVTILRLHTGTLIGQPTRRYWDLQPHPDGGDHLAQIELDGVDAVLRLAELHNRATKALDLAEARIWLPDPCPHCGRKALLPSNNQERVTCQACRITWDSDHFALLSNVLDFERQRIKQ